ncbi:MAG: DegT/DnrJ/EryC1/StrS family aminotransferase [Bacteroidetes bacterium]|nr:MAG: DegT/DnrJ/EryC1/StrS family aminotransferase [Bacteroidota bacterium]TAG86252.1 MAG: DegT/DnrJ/EryC1/StrS family aminotransferase [Bacteroidota bacterium]
MPGSELFGVEERKEVNDVLETGILFRYNHDVPRKGHWKTREFENQLAQFNGVKHALACSSGSTAVAIAMAACGIGLGDEVIVPPFTYIATVEGALLAGALPIFAEIDETLCISPEGLKKAITPKTKALVLVHMCGSMAKIEEIMQICEANNITIIEDTAQGLGASYKGKPAGTFGKVGTFSFDFFKIITCGEGGAMITNDTNLYHRADQFSDHGHDHIGDNRGAEGHPLIGFNYRLGEMNAAVGVAQMRKIDYILAQQRKNKKILHDTLAQFPEITFRHIPDVNGDAATFMDFFLPNEELTRKAVKALIEEGVPALTGVQYWYDNNFHYIKNWEHLRNLTSAAPIYANIVPTPQDYNNYKEYLPITENLMARLISFVVKVAWTDEQIKDLTTKITKAFEKVFAKEMV